MRDVGGTATAIASYGSLGVATYARRFFGDSELFPADPATNFTANAYWDDVLTITSNTLAVGTLVNVTMRNEIFVTQAFARLLVGQARDVGESVSLVLREMQTLLEDNVISIWTI